MNSVALLAPAKVNLRLVVLGRESSGYHGLETLFCGVALADRLEIRVGAPGIELEVVGEVATGPPERNLAVLAARAFFRATGIRPAVRLRLEKNIPAQAGLGGGSSDAAATLRGLNLLHDAPCDAGELLRLGGTIGSDVPFFLAASPLALGWSRGERLLELAPLAERPVLVAHPGIAMPTPAAFGRLAEMRPDRYDPVANAIRPGDFASWEGVERIARNDLEEVARERIPGLDAAKQALARAGATIALLAGSGSSVFGVFHHPTSLPTAEHELRRLGMATWRTHTLSDWPGLAIPISQAGISD